MKILHVALTAVAFSISGHAFAQKTTIEARVTGLDGKPAKSAGVQIERQDKKTPPILTSTDGRGQYKNTNLEPGTYKVTVLASDIPPQSQIVTTTAKAPVLVTVDMKKAAGPGYVPVKKVFVWVDPPTGSHMGGHYEERGAAGKKRAPGAQNTDTVGAKALDTHNIRELSGAAGR